jgi:hypothetical protein
MKKSVFLIIIAFCVISIRVQAQYQKATFSFSPSLIVPTGLLGISNSIGFGAEITATLPYSENVSFYGSTGIGVLLGKKLNYGGGYSETNSNATYIPFIVGAKYQSNQIYGGMGFGYASYNFGEGDSESGLSIRPEFGFDLNKKVTVKAMYTTTMSNFNIDQFSFGASIKL